MYVGVENGGMGVNYGTVEYWVRLRVPMAQALRLYKVSSPFVIHRESLLTQY